MPVEQMLRRISARELAEWEAYEHLYGPVSVEARVDRAAAVIAAQLANTFRGKDTRPFEVKHFMPRWDVRPLDGEEAAGGAAP
ncbi:hypothetical protein [Nonomuraea sp. NPDC050202]|uniref:phage tail assembly protein T n=1 Tax=Nonomuraea sp. NPDC050202 TaxID=3155035 RepID=UPI003406091F